MFSHQGGSLTFWRAVGLHFWKWANTISVLFLNTERAPFVASAFVKKWGFDSHSMTFLQRETNLHGHDKRVFKPLQAATSQKGERSKSSENHENTSRFTKCHVSPWKSGHSCFLLLSLMQCVCVMFPSTPTGLEQPHLWLCHKTLGFKQEFVVPKDAVEREGREMGTSQKRVGFWKGNELIRTRFKRMEREQGKKEWKLLWRKEWVESAESFTSLNEHLPFIISEEWQHDP